MSKMLCTKLVRTDQSLKNLIGKLRNRWNKWPAHSKLLCAILNKKCLLKIRLCLKNIWTSFRVDKVLQHQLKVTQLKLIRTRDNSPNKEVHLMLNSLYKHQGNRISKPEIRSLIKAHSRRLSSLHKHKLNLDNRQRLRNLLNLDKLKTLIKFKRVKVLHH